MKERTVLFVDDDCIVLRSIARGLLGEPYNVCLAKSSEEALKILSQREVHVLVTDIRMPEMDGTELLKIITEKYPHIVKMVLSGYTNTTNLTKAIHQEGVFKFIPKPWNLQEGEEFRAIVRNAIDHYNLQNECAETVRN
ncbi:MAG: response regulator [Sedimentisphaerales bacterium]|nr:response regulator [Sedimentisphaerales bacterium]